jgi:cephalosporin hydroxylase
MAKQPVSAESVLVWHCSLPGSALSNIQRGTLRTRYKGLAFLKSPFDIALYMQLIDRLRPGAIIEIGCNEGGSAKWFADMMEVFSLKPRVVSLDLPQMIEQLSFSDDRITFIGGDALRLGDALPLPLLESLPHPWLVVEDSAHFYETSRATIEFFDKHLRSGDYLVVEDGIVKFLPEDVYRSYQDGPTRAVEEFLVARSENYEIERDLCDFYGKNATWSPNSWLRRR